MTLVVSGLTRIGECMDRRKSLFFRRTGIIALLAGSAVFALPSVADTTDRSLSAGGSYTSFGGKESTSSGSNIPTLSVTGNGTPAKNGAALSIIDGFSGFSSGIHNGNGSNWSWGDGVKNLMGCVSGVTAKICNGLDNVNLLRESFQSVQIQSNDSLHRSSRFRRHRSEIDHHQAFVELPDGSRGSADFEGLRQAGFANVTGTLNAQVAADFGVSSQFNMSSSGASIVADGNPGSFLFGTNPGGSVNATPSSNVPEVWGIDESLAFFALAFLAFTALLRFRVLLPVPAT